MNKKEMTIDEKREILEAWNMQYRSELVNGFTTADDLNQYLIRIGFDPNDYVALKRAGQKINIIL